MKLATLIPDTGLLLAVIDKLVEDGHEPLDPMMDDLIALADEEFEDNEQLDASEQCIQRALTLVREAEAPFESLAEITAIDFDGGNNVYMEIEIAINNDTGGEGDAYLLGSLEGFEHLTGVKTLSFDAYGYSETPIDLTPLTNHPALETIILRRRCVSVDPLLTISSLKQVKASSRLTPSQVDALTAHGLEVIQT